MPRKPNLPNLREHDARRILAKCRRHGCRKAATVVGGLVHSQEKARARTEGLRGQKLLESGHHTEFSAS